MELHLLSFTFFILQLLDWYTTSTILKNGGYEQNPLMSILFKYFDINVVMCMKSIILPLLGYVIGLEYPLLLMTLIVIYLIVVIHNWKSL